MEEELRNRIAALEEENQALHEELSSAEAELDEAKAIQVGFKPLFPESTQSLSASNENLSNLNSALEKMNEAKKVVVDAEEKIALFQSSLDEARVGLFEIKVLDKKGEHAVALAKIDELDALTSKEGLENSSFVTVLKEILAYEKCALLTHFGEKNVAQGNLPMGKDEANAFREFASNLTTIFHPIALKEAYVDEAFGLRYCLAYRSVNINAPTLEGFRELREAVLLAEGNKEKRSSLTAARAKILYDVYLKFFNRLSYEYFENEPNYDKALEVFLGKDVLDEEKIEHYAYKENKEEKDFYFAFTKASALKKDPAAFKDWILVTGQKAFTGDDLSFLVLAHIVSMPLLDAAKFNIALNATKPFDFVQMLSFMEQCVRLGIDREKASLVFDELEKKKREGDFSKMAPSINYLNFHIDATLRDRFNALRLSLLRSPKAHRVKVKSTDENVHLAFGEEKDDYPLPVGKPLANQDVKAWSMGKLVMFWLFAAIIPALLGIAGIIAINLANLEGNLASYLLIIPMMFIYFFVLLIGLEWFGRDEYEAARYRRTLMVLATIIGIVPLVYWISPADFPMFAVWSLPLFITSIVVGVVAMLLFRERKKGHRYVCLILFALVVIAASVFFVLAGVNNLI